MSSLSIRGLEPRTKERLRVRAAHHGRSMEAEARAILRATLDGPGAPLDTGLGDRIRARFEALGGVELELPPRQAARAPPDL